MAAMARPSVLHFLVSFSLLASRFFVVHGITEWTMSCGGQVDITSLLTQAKTSSGILNVAIPKDFSQYQDMSNPRECDITIVYSPDMQLLIELYYVDIIPQSGDRTSCTVGLEVFDYFNGRSEIYPRVCGEAWKWEERHRESNMEKRISRSSPVTFRLKSNGGGAKGNGFKVHFNEFRPTLPCYPREFTCREKQRCINDDLTCDGWDDCDDRTDEEDEAGCQLLAESEVCAVFIGCLYVIGTTCITVVFFIKYCRRYKEYKIRSESKMGFSNWDNRSIQESQMSFPRRYNSQESMAKSAYSRNGFGGMVINNSVGSLDKLGSEKGDRMSYKGSERSYKKGRSLSHAVDGSERGKSPDRDRRSKDRRSYYTDSDSDRDDKYRRRRSRERSRDRYSDDDSDYERERRRRRRRRSYDSEDDSDSDRDSRRRRRRRRSYDRYSDEDSESERERERRRRRRSKERRRERGEDPSDKEKDTESERRLEKEREANSYTEKPREEEKVREYERNRGRQRDRPREQEKPVGQGDDQDKPKEEETNVDNRRPYSRRRSRERDPNRRPEDRETTPIEKEKAPVMETTPTPPTAPPEPTTLTPTAPPATNGPTESYSDRRRRRSAERRANRGEDERPPESRYDRSPRRDERRSGSRDNLREDGPPRGRDPRDRFDEPAPPPTSEELRQREMQSKPEVGQLGREAVKEYRRRSGDDRRTRRRSRGAPQPGSEGPPVYEDVVAPQDYGGFGGYKEAAV